MLRSLLESKLALSLLALLGGALIGGAVVAWQTNGSASAHTGSASTHTGSSSASGDTATSTSASSSATSGLAAYDKNGDGVVYQGGMHPDIVQDEPGSCPICGMQLTPVQVGANSDEGTVRVSPATLQNVGVRTARVSVGPLSRQVRTTGRFEASSQLMKAVSPKVSGWVDELHVNYEGVRVREGEALFEIYSPELVATQEEYLTALRNARRLEDDPGSQRLLDAARRRLANWDISDEQIRRLEETGTPTRTMTFHAPSGGTVTNLKVTEGEKISAGQTLMHVTRLSPLWLMVDVYEQDLAWIDVGAEASVQLPYSPGSTLEGRVGYVYDEVDPDTRTVRARITVPNPDRSLKPGMYATVTLRGGQANPTPLVPQEAVVSSGEREVVIVALGEGRFRPVPVTTGLTAQGQTQVLRGLDGGEEVVTSAQFLIDSEARLQGALSAMTSGSHDHGGTSRSRTSRSKTSSSGTSHSEMSRDQAPRSGASKDTSHAAHDH